MSDNEVRLDVARLREAVEDATGAAAFAVSPVAMMDLIETESASPSELVHMAEGLGIDWRRYVVG